MPQFNDRERSEEARYALDAEMQFKAEARRNKLLGIWAAELMSFTGDDAKAYAADVVAADLTASGEEDVFHKVATDLRAKGVEIPDAVIRQKMVQLAAVAKEQIVSET
ncbi:MAG TPA: DUF1476 domain-containing protein [Devosiaceae bacterium]|jgi:hypothetical protein|nr:DUF1476 domain-containing protein [Devosiaceae bacterium]